MHCLMINNLYFIRLSVNFANDLNLLTSHF